VSKIAISGSWRGFYFYDSASLPSNFQVPFELHLQRTPWAWLTGGFVGTVQDGLGGLPEQGRIKGALRASSIRFKKFVPVGYLVDQKGNLISMREHICKQGHQLNQEITPSPLFYKGVFHDPAHASGSWKIFAANVRVGNLGYIRMPSCSGKWTLERKA